MIKGFKDFVMRGNVVDLAVGIAIGVAFTTLVGCVRHQLRRADRRSRSVADTQEGFGFHITDSEATFVNIGGIINALHRRSS